MGLNSMAASEKKNIKTTESVTISNQTGSLFCLSVWGVLHEVIESSSFPV